MGLPVMFEWAEGNPGIGQFQYAGNAYPRHSPDNPEYAGRLFLNGVAIANSLVAASGGLVRPFMTWG